MKAARRILRGVFYIPNPHHYVLSMGAVFSMLGGLYFWFEKITGVCYAEILGKIHFWSFFVGVNLTFFPMHFLLRRCGFWFKPINETCFFIGSGTSTFKDPTDIKCLVGQRAWEVGLTKCTLVAAEVLSEQPHVACLTQVNLHFKIPVRIINRVYSVTRAHYAIFILGCKERLRHSSLEHRRNLNNYITARLSESESKFKNGNLEWDSTFFNLNKFRWWCYSKCITWNKKSYIATTASIGPKKANQAKVLSNFWDNVGTWYW